MLTIKYRDDRGSESIIPGVAHTSWHEGALTGTLSDGGSVTFGPNFNRPVCADTITPVAFVVNENGATVAKYDFHMLSFEDTLKIKRRAEMSVNGEIGEIDRDAT